MKFLLAFVAFASVCLNDCRASPDCEDCGGSFWNGPDPEAIRVVRFIHLPEGPLPHNALDAQLKPLQPDNLKQREYAAVVAPSIVVQTGDTLMGWHVTHVDEVNLALHKSTKDGAGETICSWERVTVTESKEVVCSNNNCPCDESGGKLQNGNVTLISNTGRGLVRKDWSIVNGKIKMLPPRAVPNRMDRLLTQ